MADDDRAPDTEARERVGDEGCLAAGRGVRAGARTVAEAVAGAIDQEDAPGRGQPVSEDEALVLEIAARSVQQDNREIMAALRGAELHDVQPAAAHRHENAGGTVRTLDQPDADGRERSAKAEDRDNRQTADQDHVARGP